MAVIKLVEGIWTFQKRKESADEIAESGRKLYEKLTNFAQTFVSVGRAIEQSHDAYQQARGQLATGKGNAIKLAENLKQLGVTPAPGKQMPAQLLQPDQDEDE
jgi:DNA recombination protein RmuC